MRKKLDINVYTQINTNETEYLIQNISLYEVLIIVSDTQPSDGASYDFILSHGNGISGTMITGKCWGKPAGKTSITVGIVEG